jgi:predicted RNA binding protein YcfA (HicA-like mRNA interferase family)
MPRLTPVKIKKYQKFLEYVGCFYKRTKGDHLVYNRKGLLRPIIFPKEREIPKFIIRNNLRTLNISLDEYFEILKKL